MMIEKLINAGICFAIMKSFSYLTKEKYYQNTEYEILALSEDFPTLQDDNFQFNDDMKETPRSWFNPPGIISRKMNLNDISEFNKMKDEYFNKVYDTQDGTVHELKTNSLQELFHQKNK